MREVGTAVIVKDGKFLIAQRAKHKEAAGLWEFPGGKREEGETLQECLERELMEEFEIKAEVDEFIMDSLYKYPHGEFLLKVFRVSIPDNANLILKEHQDLCWVNVEDMNNYDFSAADLPIIEKLKDLFHKSTGD